MTCRVLDLFGNLSVLVPVHVLEEFLHGGFLSHELLEGEVAVEIAISGSEEIVDLLSESIVHFLVKLHFIVLFMFGIFSLRL